MQDNQIINLETKINSVKQLITNYRNELIGYENTLAELEKEFIQIKQNSMKSINKNSPQDFEAIK